MAPAPEPLGYVTPIAGLHPSPLNPRKHFSDLDDLATNIKARGVLVPLLVRRNGKGLEIVDGERRYRAAQLAGVTDAPVIERELTDEEVLEIQLISAIQRQDLTPLEEARGYKALIASNRSKYSAAYIADRIGRSEKYVVDRMRLLHLVPALQQLLDEERFGVAHAELLAKLKPEDQARASSPDAPGRSRGDISGLWAELGRTLDFDIDDEGKLDKKDPYAHLKPVTVKELEAWIARHVRFDVEHSASTAPLEFGDTAIKVEAAAQQPGRGKKVIQITADYRAADDVRDPSERVYGVQSWRRADGSVGTTELGNGRKVNSTACAHSVLGVFAVGPGYGTTMQVCIARDRCRVHWKKEVEEREKNRKLREAGQGAKAAKREKKAEETYEQRWKREAAERKARQDAWAAIWKHLLPAVVSQVAAARELTAKQVTYFEREEIYIDPIVCKKHGVAWSKNLTAAILISEVIRGEESDDLDDFVKVIAQPLGLDIEELEAIRDAHAPKPAVEAPAKKATAKKAAKKR